VVSEPGGVACDALGELLAPVIAGGRAPSWSRQMVLGPAPDICRLPAGEPELPPEVSADVPRLDPV
jgi:hypothetical protein